MSSPDSYPRDSTDQLSALRNRVCELELDLAAANRRESMYRTVLDISRDVIYKLNLPGGDFDYVSPACQTLIGYSPREMMSMGLYGLIELLHPDERDSNLAKWQQVIQNAEEADFLPVTEYRVRAAAGEYRWLSDSRVLLRDEQGRPTAVVGSLRDVTTQKIKDDIRRQTEEQLRLILENTTDGINMVEVDSKTCRRRIVMCNDRYAEMTGRPREELLALNDINTIFTNHEPEYYRRMQEGRPYQGLSGYLRPDGKENYFEWTGAPVEVGERLYVVGIDRDITQRVLSERQMRQQQMQFEMVLQHTTDGINLVEIDPLTRRRRLVMCNDRYVEMSGRSREELMALDDINPLFASHNLTNYQGLEVGKAFQGRTSWLRPDGKENYFEWTGVPVQKGDKVYVVGIDRDVTERVQAERTLRLQQERLELILQYSTDGINFCRIDPPTGGKRLVLCNDRWVEMSGRTREELIAEKDLNSLIVIHQPVDVAEARRRLREEGTPLRGLGSWLRPDGKENYFEYTAAAIRMGGELFLMGIDRDVTERVQAEQDMQLQRQRLELILQCSTDGIDFCSIDPQGNRRLVLCNDRFVEMSGRSRDELFAAENLNELTNILDPADVARDRLQVYRDGQAQRGLASWKRPDGKENIYEWTAAPIRMGDQLFIVGVDRDVTESLRAHRALEAANRKLLNAAEEERRLLAGELHDSVSQSLVALRLAIQTILFKCEQADLQGIENNLAETADRCNKIVAEVRAICHGLYPAALESLGLLPALRSLARDFQQYVPVRVDCQRKLQNVRFGHDLEIAFFRVAQEALSNAIRHSECAGIEICLSRRANRLRLEVRDNGKGFDPAKVDSTGIGLNTMRQRADAVGGTLTIASRPGETRILIEANAPLPNPLDGRG